ncbi:metal-dependent hydrolase [Natrinema versiforme]|uniref:metal-dependent hydrolase n=1 Tax=Natrinema versiforme TaxID=88724 RepID=UPI0009FE65B6|nr:metal-dependent hydrolase [Natrinema versiforme]
MTGFDGHLRLAVIGGIGFTIAATYAIYHFGVIGIGQDLMLFSGIVFAAVVLGGIVPDVDVHSSKPRQGLGKVLKAIAVFLPVLLLLNNPSLLRTLGFRLVEALELGSIPVVYVGLAATMVFTLLIAKSIGYGLDELFNHRGFFHSKEFLGLCGVVAFGLSYSAGILPRKAAMAIGAAAAFGVFIHVYVGDR